MFIKYNDEKDIKQFFMKNIDGLLEKYEPGLPNMKPDVLKQIKEIEARRDVMVKDMEEKQNNGPIMFNEAGKPPKQLNNREVVAMITNQQKIINQLQAEKQELLNQLSKAHSDIIEISMKQNIMNNINIAPPIAPPIETNLDVSKLRPEKIIDISNL